MNHNSKWRQNERNSAEHQSTAGNGPKEFDSVEDMLRFDASQNPPPHSILGKLSQSTGREKREASLWERFIGIFKSK